MATEGRQLAIATATADLNDFPRPIASQSSAIPRSAKRKLSRLQAIKYKFQARANQLDTFEWFLVAFAAFLGLWVVSITIILMLVAVRYLGTTVQNDREWYLLHGCTSWAQAEVERLLYAALSVQQAVRAATCTGYAVAPHDYGALERALAPIVLAERAVSSVELAFAGTSDRIFLRRRVSGGGAWVPFMQSNSNVCYLLGADGCVESHDLLSSGVWVDTALNLEESNDSVCGAFDWATEPELLLLEVEPDDPVANMANPAVAWFPSYHLHFRSKFHRLGLPVAGRVTLSLGSLSGSALRDTRLGEDGSVYLCDGTGRILASQNPDDLLVVDAQTGALYFRSIWDLPSTEAFPGLREAFLGDAAKRAVLQGESEERTSWLAVVVPLPEPHGRFATVVVSRSLQGFGDDTQRSLSFVAVVAAALPYFALVSVTIGTMIYQWSTLVKNPHMNAIANDFLGDTGISAKKVNRLMEGNPRLTRKISQRPELSRGRGPTALALARSR